MSLVCIFSDDNEGVAQHAAEYLESRGIPCFLKNAHTQNLFGGLKIFTGFDPVVGAIQVWVNEDQAEEAARLLNEAQAEDAAGFPLGDDVAPDDAARHDADAASPDANDTARAFHPDIGESDADLLEQAAPAGETPQNDDPTAPTGVPSPPLREKVGKVWAIVALSFILFAFLFSMFSF